jgi:hypothetical protein
MSSRLKWQSSVLVDEKEEEAKEEVEITALYYVRSTNGKALG